MMSSYNKTIFMGYLGRDPETKFFGDGSSVTTLSIASSESWKDRNSGERKERTTWLTAKAFGRTAEVAAEYLRKGSHVMVEGKLQNEEWEKDGVKQYRMTLRIERLMLMPSSGGRSEDREESEPRGQQTEANFDDDIPF